MMSGDELQRGPQLSADQLRRRRNRSIAIILALAALVLVMVAITMVKGPSAFIRPI